MSQIKPFHVIVAATPQGGIGCAGQKPWVLPRDWKRLEQITTPVNAAPAGQAELQNALVMGRKTWESIPPALRTLQNRLNVVLSRSATFEINDNNVRVCKSFSGAMRQLSADPTIANIFVIGGAEVYKQALGGSIVHCETIYWTKVFTDVWVFDEDRSIGLYQALQFYDLASYSNVMVDSGVPYQFLTYRRTPHPDASTTSITNTPVVSSITNKHV